MVRRFQVASTDSEISEYSGYLATAFAGCQVCCALQWGKAAERYGRKTIILTGIVGTGISMLILGFSTNYYMALFARALMGCVNGNVAIIRTVLGEIAVERKHQALAFIVMPLCGQLGSIIGAMLGGYLTNGSRDTSLDGLARNGGILEKLNEKFPFALVNIVISLLLFLSATIAFLFIEETHYKLKYKYDIGLVLGDFLLKRFRAAKQRPWMIIQDTETRLYLDAPASNDTSEDAISNDSASIEYEPLTRRESRTLIQSNKYNNESFMESIPWRRILTPNLINVLTLFFLQNIQDIVFLEFMPIYLSTDLEIDKTGYLKSQFPFHLLGGLGFSSKQTGQLLSTTGFLGLIVVLVIFPYVDRTFDPIVILKMFLSIVPLCFLLLPYVVFLAPNAANTFADYRWAYMFLYTISFMRTLCIANVKPQIALIVHRGAPKAYKALVNSLTVTTSSASRAIGPLIYGHVFSFAQKREIAWFPWWYLCVFSFATFVQSFFVDASEQDEEQPIEEQTLLDHDNLANDEDESIQSVPLSPIRGRSSGHD